MHHRRLYFGYNSTLSQRKGKHVDATSTQRSFNVHLMFSRRWEVTKLRTFLTFPQRLIKSGTFVKTAEGMCHFCFGYEENSFSALYFIQKNVFHFFWPAKITEKTRKLLMDRINLMNTTISMKNKVQNEYYFNLF